jgi:hypothetical protein
MPRRPLIKDRATGLTVGVAALVVGSYLIWEGYEGRGMSRPFALRFLPGG